VTAASRGAAGANAISANTGLGAQMREEVWAIVRAAVEEAMGPLVARQRELEARVERAERVEREREAERAKGGARSGQVAPQPAMQGAGGASAASRLASIGPVGGVASIPVTVAPSNRPPAFSAASAAVPRFQSSQSSRPAPGSVIDPGDVTIRDLKVAPSYERGASAGAVASAHPVGPRPSFAPQGYGVTVVNSPRPTLDLENVGPVDIEGFDGGRRKRRVAGVVVVLIFVLIVTVVTMAVLSHS
jgi:hypothetical protein